jgi:DNA-binding transcriptional ArsR family regulator
MLAMHAAPDPSSLLRTLADPTRRALYERLVAAGELTVGALTRDAAVSQPAISQHLKALRAAGLVTERRDGRHVHYRPEPAALAPLADWLGIYGVFWAERFDRLRSLLKEIDP